jgi:hypothetical protein
VNHICIYVLVIFEFSNFKNFFAGKLTIGAVGVTAAPANPFVGAARNTSRPYKSISMGGLGTAPINQ